MLKSLPFLQIKKFNPLFLKIPQNKNMQGSGRFLNYWIIAPVRNRTKMKVVDRPEPSISLFLWDMQSREIMMVTRCRNLIYFSPRRHGPTSTSLVVRENVPSMQRTQTSNAHEVHHILWKSQTNGLKFRVAEQEYSSYRHDYASIWLENG